MPETRAITNKWQDWVNLILAIWLFISPWALSFAPATAGASVAASWTAWILAIVIGVFSIAALVRAQPWEEWINIVAAVLLFISPWVLRYYSVSHAAMGNALIIGAITFILAIWDLNTQPGMASHTHA
ncbi:MAG: hypothetical protein OJF62_000862 [Pseudolabrys sp.]|nr:hypothetical protein [Pseudolabrys sp.]